PFASAVPGAAEEDESGLVRRPSHVALRASRCCAIAPGSRIANLLPPFGRETIRDASGSGREATLRVVVAASLWEGELSHQGGEAGVGAEGIPDPVAPEVGHPLGVVVVGLFEV